ncbi:calcium-binding protein [Alkalimarinus coralli]|uniref:calcium-binding protein n=1 Tax=Alkalimarinus coralli TaxID=2935863 RepID=UPI00202B75B2|nr:hypothetical protein [Alkalimarinus coralli]
MRAIKLDVLGDAFANPSTYEELDELKTKQNLILHGKDGIGSDAPRVANANSLWDIASENYVKEAVGNFRIIAPNNISDLSVFVQSELPALLTNSNIGSIDGIPLSDILEKYPSSSPSQIADVITHINSWSRLQVSISGLSATDTSNYLSLTPDGYLARIQANPSLLNDITSNLGEMDGAKQTEFKNWAKSTFDFGEGVAVSGGKILNKLGIVGSIAGLMFMSFEANAAEEAGDHELAIQIAEEYAVDTAGSLVGEAAGASIGGVALAVAAAAGVTVAAPLAAVVVIGASITGGIFAGGTATEYYKDFVGKTEGGKRTLIQSVSDWLFGDATTPEEIISKIPGPAEPQLEYVSLSPEYDTTGEVSPTPTLTSEEFSFYVNDLVAGAKSNMAFRHALKELSPFAILNADIDQHNTSGELDLYNPETGTGTMTEEWISARSLALLFRNIQNDGVDINGLTDDSYAIVIHHEDGELEIITTTGILGGEPKGIYLGNDMDESFEGGSNDDLFFGKGGSDTFYGKDGHDKLYGGKGNDHLTGGKGVDYLEGGEGNDTYYYNTGDGNDTLRDTQGQNVLKINGQVINNLTQIDDSEDLYLDDQGNRYYLSGDGKLYITLKDDVTGGVITVEGFNKSLAEEQYGIKIEVGEPTPPILDGAHDVGSGLRPGSEEVFSPMFEHRADWFAPQKGIIYDANAAKGLWGKDGSNPYGLFVRGGTFGFQGGNGNDSLVGGDTSVIYKGTPEWDAAYAQLSESIRDYLKDNPGQNYIGGTDQLFGRAGDDFIDGKDGDNYLYGGIGNDQIFGGKETDYISGNFAFDAKLIYDSQGKWIGFSDSELAITNPDYMYPSETGNGKDLIFSGAGKDYVSGDRDNDLISSGAGSDYVGGGHGSDIIYTGTGDDLVYADSNIEFTYHQRIEDSIVTSFTIPMANAIVSTVAGETYDDKVWGGSGQDWILGEVGDDTLYGGEGDDHIWGDRHTDPSQLPRTTYFLDESITDFFRELPLELNGNDHLYGGKEKSVRSIF